MRTRAIVLACVVAVSACGGDDGADDDAADAGPPDAAPPDLVLPSVVDLPYVVAGAGGSDLAVPVVAGGAAITAITWTLTGDPTITMDQGPPSLAAGETAMLTFHFAGAPAETIAVADLAVTSAATTGTRHIPVFAVAGAVALGAASWTPVTLPGGVACGDALTMALPTAPYPSGDASVHVFVPESYRDLGAHTLVLHFHGFNTTLAATLPAHRYDEHLYASGADAILVVPQGPVNAASGDFGQLMTPAGTEALLREVLVLLYREQRLTHPVLANVVLTSHSGGYQAVAANLDPTAPFVVSQVALFDSLYGAQAAYLAYAQRGGRLRSDYTTGGGTLANNQAFATSLATSGVPVATEATQRSLRDDPAVIFFSDTSHEGSTGIDSAYGEQLRWGLDRSRRGPRVELREAVPSGPTTIDVRWFAPRDPEVTAFDIELSFDGGVTYVAVQQAGPLDDHAAVPLMMMGGGGGSGARVRLAPRLPGVAPADALRSDVFRVDVGAQVLVVDGFDRVVDGGYGGLAHDFATLVAEAAGGAATISHRAVSEDGFDLSPWPTVIWLLGDESTADQTFAPAEQAAVQAYVGGGGRLIVSGSEVAWDLDAQNHGATLLHDLGAAYLADDSGSNTVQGGGLATPATYNSPGGAYVAGYPDVLGASGAPGAQVLLTYGSGTGAAAGIAGRSVVVGFPLELIDDPADLVAVIAALLAFVDG